MNTRRAPRKGDRGLSRVERVIDRSTFHFDVAACIRWFLFGLAAIVIATATMIAAYRDGKTPPAATIDAASAIITAVKYENKGQPNQ